MLNSLGSPVTVYDRHSLQTTSLAQERVTQLLLTQDAPIGATALHVAYADGSNLAGRLPAGLVLALGGAEIALATTAIANGEAELVLMVPALEIGADEGATVALADSADSSYIFRRKTTGRVYAPGSGIVTGRVRGALHGSVAPSIGALLLGEEIFRVEAIAGSATDWRVEAGAQ